MKYIVFETIQESPKKVPLIFPDILVHREMAKYLSEAIRRHLGVESKCYSAGFIEIKVTACHGKSESLSVNAHPDDANMLDMYNYFHGICSRPES